MRRHHLALLLVMFALLPAGHVHANPLEPPPEDQLRVWLVKRQGTTARKLTSTVNFPARYRTPGQAWAGLTIVSFRMQGTRRVLTNGLNTLAAFSDTGFSRFYVAPVVTGCPAVAVCAWPPTVHETLRDDGAYSMGFPLGDSTKPTTLSFYVIAANIDATVTPSPGWTIRELSQASAAMRYARVGAGAHISPGTGADVATGATMTAEGPSYAAAFLPCPGLGARLSGGDDTASGRALRDGSCYAGPPPSIGTVPMGTGSRPTTWTLTALNAGVGGNGSALLLTVLPKQT